MKKGKKITQLETDQFYNLGKKHGLGEGIIIGVSVLSIFLFLTYILLPYYDNEIHYFLF